MLKDWSLHIADPDVNYVQARNTQSCSSTILRLRKGEGISYQIINNMVNSELISSRCALSIIACTPVVVGETWNSCNDNHGSAQMWNSRLWHGNRWTRLPTCAQNMWWSLERTKCAVARDYPVNTWILVTDRNSSSVCFSCSVTINTHYGNRCPWTHCRACFPPITWPHSVICRL